MSYSLWMIIIGVLEDILGNLLNFGAHGTDASIFFSNRVINRWNQLDQRAVGASSINAFKGWLNKIRATRLGFFVDSSAKPYRPPRWVFWLVRPHKVSNKVS